MRIALAALAIVLCSLAPASAQQRRASPHDSVSANVGGAELTIYYGRPYMRGRTIMGSLVPYGRVWCPGADEATTLATSKTIKIGDLTLAAGRYTLWMLPAADAWTLIVNKQTGQWHTQYRESEDLGRVAMKKTSLAAPLEQLTFSIEKNGDNEGARGGEIRMRWDTADVSVPFTVVE